MYIYIYIYIYIYMIMYIISLWMCQELNTFAITQSYNILFYTNIYINKVYIRNYIDIVHML